MDPRVRILHRRRSLDVTQLGRKTHRVRIEGIAAVRFEEASRAHHQHQRQLDRHGNLGDPPNPPVLGQLHFGGLNQTQLGGMLQMVLVLLLLLVGESFHLLFLVQPGFFRVRFVHGWTEPGLGPIRFCWAGVAILFAAREKDCLLKMELEVILLL